MNGITQSAVSQQVRALERRFRVKLIERGRKNFSLTPEGRAFLQASHQVMDILGIWKAGFTICRIWWPESYAFRRFSASDCMNCRHI